MKNVYPVGKINQYIKNMFAQDFMLQRICIKGEVSNCKYHSSGHVYFTLKDSDGAIRVVMFRSNRIKGLHFQMKEGDRVVVTGSVEVYEKEGTYQLYAREVELDGEGELFLKFEALRRELEEMGMFAEQFKQPVPRFARRIGIVTAPTGAAIQDIRNVSYRRNPHVQLILYPALVQGEGAVPSIVDGIRTLDRLGVDVLIVGRGGGSIEDLWAFNEEDVARAIFNCGTPVISAVGHQTDWTIADYVADMRAPTPSAAAELAVFDEDAVKQTLLEQRQLLNKNMKRKLELEKLRLSGYQKRICYFHPQSRLHEKRKYAADCEERLFNIMTGRIKDSRHRLSLFASTLEGVSPVRKLGSGYAFVEDAQGKALRSVSGVQKTDKLQIHLLDGEITAQVKEIKPGTTRKVSSFL